MHPQADNTAPHRLNTKASSTPRSDADLLVRAAALIGEQPTEAVKLADRAIDLARRSNQPTRLGEASLVAAQAYWRTGDLQKAAVHIDAALAAFESGGQRRRLGAAYTLRSMLFITHDKVSLALTAAVKALGYPDLTAKDRARLYTTVAICFHHLIDFSSGSEVMEDYAWPEAERSGDAPTLVACSSRCVGMLHAYACWSLDIPNTSTVGEDKPKLAAASDYTARAGRYLSVCESFLASVPASDRSWALGQKGLHISFTQGWDRARPIFDEALSYATHFPRERVAALTSAGIAARIAKQWEVARSYLETAKACPAAEYAYNRRVLAYELSLVYEALGDYEAALEAMRSFAHLQTLKARLANQWISDPESKQRYGTGLDLAAAKEFVFEKIQPAVLKRAVAYVENNLDKRLLLREVARHVSVSARTLQHLFKVHHAVPVSAFIRERRMQCANDLLQQGCLSVRGVAERIGYSNLANFSRDYRRRFGCTPSSVLDASAEAGRRYDRFRIENLNRPPPVNGAHTRRGAN